MNPERYWERYAEFFKKREKAKGYEFHQAPVGSAPPPPVTFPDKLRWWSWDRWRRLKKVREERDRRLQEIVELQERQPRPSQ